MLSPHSHTNASSGASNRIRFPTQRRKSGYGEDLWNRHRNRTATNPDISLPQTDSKAGPPKLVVDGVPGSSSPPPDGTSNKNSQSGRRTIHFNVPFPTDPSDPNGGTLGPPTYPRNKIRTAKYTPLSFIPKNLLFQFKNVANIYFLFTIILGAFPVFGVVNPGLNAVPLIVILTLTALKDAIEDWRRTVLDRELNNAPVHRLTGYNNLNSSNEHVSVWRRMKKATSRFVESIWRLWKERGNRPQSAGILDGTRPSIDTHHRASFFSNRLSIQSSRSPNENIPMTPVSPTSQSTPFVPKRKSVTLEVPDGREKETIPKSKGNVINPGSEPPRKAKFVKDYWKHIKVGDFVRIYDGDEIPADVALLSTSQDDGTCYIETKNLDGETNLKVRTAMQCTRKVRHAYQCEQAEFVIESESPHQNLYTYNGAIHWNDYYDPHQPGRSRTEAITINQILLRGSMLRNTEWVLAVVLFTGVETKIMLNSGATPSKRAHLSKNLNMKVVYNFIILFLMCLVAGIVNGTIWAQGGNSQDYFEYGSYGNSAVVNGVITFWAGIILFQNLVPISLYITLEIVRTFQAVFIYNDIHMYYPRLDYPCTPKSWNISDDVGQIEYIFSDKTGTLTQNVMEFKKCTINGVPYGKAYTEAQAGLHRRQGLDVQKEAARAKQEIETDKAKMVELIDDMFPNQYFHSENLTFVSSDYIDHLSGTAGPEQQSATIEFMLALALCHTVVAEKSSGNPPVIEFKAQSPDEAALVATARDCGFTVLGRKDDKLTLDVLGTQRVYTILKILEFNSSRKRMSVIVRLPAGSQDNASDGRIVLFCKGADSMIFSRLIEGAQPELRKTTAQDLETFAREGLRTLCIAKKELTQAEYDTWERKHEKAESAIDNRDEELEKVADEIERDLELLGGTAIEDRLQDGVPDSIALLGEAGIKLWVLTGDKVETAINIGFSCNLLSSDMQIISLQFPEKTIESAEKVLDINLAKFGLKGTPEELEFAKHNHETPPRTHALVVDGDALKFMLDESIRNKFLLLCQRCRSVLCCRVSPAQKADVVRLVKTGFDCLTLSIGDGANDVAMIQEAHVGVGIAGEEGRAAVMSADYAIGQFRFLTRLLLVHGRWSYRRLAETISNFFYKNVIWAFTLFWYNIYATFDCPNVFDYTYIILFNLAFTSLPVIFMGVLDQDVSDKVSLVVPQLYRRGIERKEWTSFKFWAYMIDGVYQSVIVFFFAYLVFYLATPASFSGQDIADTKRIGVYVAAAAVIVSNLYVMMNLFRWDWLTSLITVISVLLFFFWTGVFTTSTSSQLFYDAAAQVFGQASFWAMVFVTIIVCLLPRFCFKYVQKTFFPLDVDIIREQVKMGRFDYLKDNTDYIPPPPDSPLARSPNIESDKHGVDRPDSDAFIDDDRRPFYPPSTGPEPSHRSNTGSDGTNYTFHSLPPMPEHGRASIDAARRSMDRSRRSMGPIHESQHFSDFPSARKLSRVESTRCSIDSKRQSVLPPPQ